MSELNTVMPSSMFTSVNKENPIEEHTQPSAVSLHEKETQSVNDLNNNKETKEEDKLTPSEMTETVDEMNSFLQEMKRNLSFSVDEQLGESVIIVKDSETEEVIRQIPSEELVVLRKKMDDLTGILFDTKV